MIAVCLCFQLAIATSAKTKPITVTGWISDESCGAQHTKPGGELRFRKCLRGGAHWASGMETAKMVLVTDEGQDLGSHKSGIP